MIGRDAVVAKSALDDPAWDYVALGHVHKHQSLNEDQQPPIVYAGSLERIDFGEEGDPKGFCWVELPRGNANEATRAVTWEFVEVDARPFVTIRVDVREEEEPLKALEAAIAGRDIDDAVVRLIVQLRGEQEPALRDYALRELLSGAYTIGSISRDVERKARVRLGDQSPEEMTDRELLERYLEVKETPDERISALLDHAERIFHRDD
jgi:exonuclease SbcD